jgi:hypothetical protein
MACLQADIDSGCAQRHPRRAGRMRGVMGAAATLWLASIAMVMAGERVLDERVHIYEVVVEGQPRTVLSFLPKERVFSKGLAGPAIIGSLRKGVADGGELEADNLVINPAFVTLLHRVIATHAPTDPAFQRAAREQSEGWMYVIDRRTPTPGGHVPAEDIIGSFEVREGVATAASYQPFRSHRLVSERGLFQLDRFLHPKLMDALMQLEQDGD